MQPTSPVWRKSSYSEPQGDCVEVAGLPGMIAVRDSKDPGGGVLVFSPRGFRSLLTAARRGR